MGTYKNTEMGNKCSACGAMLLWGDDSRTWWYCPKCNNRPKD
jgi:predicted RNA-binding Zn-ribbon protein involved in translation (DUF1610 family)